MVDGKNHCRVISIQFSSFKSLPLPRQLVFLATWEVPTNFAIVELIATVTRRAVQDDHRDFRSTIIA
jgi:hypothetical protein